MCYCEVEAEFVQTVATAVWTIVYCTIERKAQWNTNAVVNRMSQTVRSVLLFVYVIILS